MKKVIYALSLILIIFTFTACSNNSESAEQNNAGLSLTFPNTTTEKQVFKDSIYEKVYFEMLGTRVNVTVDKSLNDQLEEAKIIKEPVLDDSMKEVGSVWVQYKNSNEMVEFGKVYTGAENKMYIQAFENDHSGVLCISEGNENNSNLLF